MERENTKNSSPETAENVEATAEASNELSEPRWAVVSFEQCAAANLTYEQAAQKIAELAAKKVSGLCIITDEAAARLERAAG